MKQDDDNRPGIDRRTFLAGGTTAMAAIAAGVTGASSGFIQDLLHRNFKEISPDRLQRIVREMEDDYTAKYGKQVTVSTAGALPGVLYGYGLDLSRCVGCRRCVYGCVNENNQSRDPQVHWIRVLKMDKSKGIHLEESDPYYNPETVPEEDAFYMPVACQQCQNAPCVKVCPVEATWQEPDGIVVVDYDHCIGCRCCMAACPYGARHFNWAEPELAAEEVNPDMHYLGNRPRPKGVVEKCTFCIQRVRKGRYPACVEICPVGARKFGNLLDEESEMRVLMREKRVFVLKEDLNTQPKFYYFYAT
ncbi:MAG: 4Fe-4S dicluster domain-containing protein [Acidobacteriota bacterium]|nr:4Fe-4S dicluster domain-containing protein [Acidobacteriota bacterium]MDH3785205.1 4Fe-4S dicluster domain-containing protein [Acidobacteriota bacterium]